MTLAVGLLACEDAPPAPPAGSLQGWALLGPVAGGELTLAEVGATQPLATATTGADGFFALDPPAPGLARFGLSGGAYREEASGREVRIPRGELALEALDPDAPRSPAVLTPLTTLAAACFDAAPLSAAGAARARLCNDAVGRAFDVPEILRTRPALPPAPERWAEILPAAGRPAPEVRYGLALLGLSRAAGDAPEGESWRLLAGWTRAARQAWAAQGLTSAEAALTDELARSAPLLGLAQKVAVALQALLATLPEGDPRRTALAGYTERLSLGGAVVRIAPASVELAPGEPFAFRADGVGCRADLVFAACAAAGGCWDGGNAELGRISPDGRYRAPLAPGQKLQVCARCGDDPTSAACSQVLVLGQDAEGQARPGAGLLVVAQSVSGPSLVRVGAEVWYEAELSAPFLSEGGRLREAADQDLKGLAHIDFPPATWVVRIGADQGEVAYPLQPGLAVDVRDPATGLVLAEVEAEEEDLLPTGRVRLTARPTLPFGPGQPRRIPLALEAREAQWVAQPLAPRARAVPGITLRAEKPIAIGALGIVPEEIVAPCDRTRPFRVLAHDTQGHSRDVTHDPRLTCGIGAGTAARVAACGRVRTAPMVGSARIDAALPLPEGTLTASATVFSASPKVLRYGLELGQPFRGAIDGNGNVLLGTVTGDRAFLSLLTINTCGERKPELVNGAPWIEATATGGGRVRGQGEDSDPGPYTALLDLQSGELLLGPKPGSALFTFKDTRYGTPRAPWLRVERIRREGISLSWLPRAKEELAWVGRTVTLRGRVEMHLPRPVPTAPELNPLHEIQLTVEHALPGTLLFPVGAGGEQAVDLAAGETATVLVQAGDAGELAVRYRIEGAGERPMLLTATAIEEAGDPSARFRSRPETTRLELDPPQVSFCVPRSGRMVSEPLG